MEPCTEACSVDPGALLEMAKSEPTKREKSGPIAAWEYRHVFRELQGRGFNVAEISEWFSARGLPYTASTIRATLRNASSAPLAPHTMSARIIALLSSAEGPLTVPLIAERLKAKDVSVRVQLYALMRRGLVTRVARAKWALVCHDGATSMGRK